MANSNGWGDGAANNAIGWGQGANNAIGWGDIHADSWAGLTDISGLPTTDPDAQAFITAASITDPTQQSAINQLVVDLKGYSIKDDTVPHAGGGATYGMTKEQAIYEKTRLMEDIKSDPARLKEYNEGKKNADRLKIEKYNSLIAF